MVTPAAVNALIVGWLRQHEHTPPSDRELAAFVATLPLAAQRRAVRLYARGFLHGCEFCSAAERERAAADLGRVAERVRAALALVEALRGPPPGSPTAPADDAPCTPAPWDFCRIARAARPP